MGTLGVNAPRRKKLGSTSWDGLLRKVNSGQGWNWACKPFLSSGMLQKQGLFQGKVKSHTLGIPALGTLSQGSSDGGGWHSLESHRGLDKSWTNGELEWLDRKHWFSSAKLRGSHGSKKRGYLLGDFRCSSSFSSRCLEAELGWNWIGILDNLPGEGQGS